MGAGVQQWEMFDRLNSVSKVQCLQTATVNQVQYGRAGKRTMRKARECLVFANRSS